MMKYFIRPMLPDSSFDPDKYYDELSAIDDMVYIGGNSDFTGLNTQLKTDIESAINSAWWDIDGSLGALSKDRPETEVAKEVAEALQYYFPKADKTKLKNSEIAKLYQLVYEWNWDGPYYQRIVDILTIVQGEKFVYDVIRGRSPNDWQYYICPAADENYVKEYVASVYFYTGTEYKFYNCIAESAEDLDESDYDVYYAQESLHTEQQIKAWAADQHWVGATPDTIEILPPE